MKNVNLQRHSNIVKKMSEKELGQKALYLIYVINDFAEKFQLSLQGAYSYLNRYQGIEFLDEYYSAEHLLSIDEAIDDVTLVCKRNGGGLGNI